MIHAVRNHVVRLAVIHVVRSHVVRLSATHAAQHLVVSQAAQLIRHAAHQQDVSNVLHHAHRHHAHLDAHLAAQLVAADKVDGPQVEMYSGSEGFPSGLNHKRR